MREREGDRESERERESHRDMKRMGERSSVLILYGNDAGKRSGYKHIIG